jgi:hypothetical protein
MGKMWKYEPEGPTGGDGGGKDHLKGMQFKYKTPTTIDYETDNDGNAIFPEPKETPKQEVVRKKIAKTRSKTDL